MTPIPPRPTPSSMRQPANSRPETRSATALTLVPCQASGLLHERQKHDFHATFGMRSALPVAAAALAQDALDAAEVSRIRHIPPCQLHRLPRHVGHCAKPPVAVRQPGREPLARGRERCLLDRLAVEPLAAI